MRLRKVASFAGSIALFTVATLLSLIAAEIVVRHVDGYQLVSWRLVRAATTEPMSAVAERIDTSPSHAAGIALAPAMQPDWFERSPEPRGRKPVDSALAEAARRFAHSGAPQDGFRLFNWNYVRDLLCDDIRFRNFPGFMFVFDAPESSARPGFRFPRNVTTPTGLVTNDFGFRGPPIALAKPEKTIRIAFVGASTTVNPHSYPFSYPELAAFWLDLWIQAQGLDLRIEVINAGREGSISNDIAAIVRDELLPLQPDLAVYYEGSNQFTPEGTVRFTNAFRFRRDLLRRLQSWSDRWALAQRLAEVVRRTSVGEPNRDYEPDWPPDLDENDPPLRRPNLPANLSTIVADLDDISARLRFAGSELVLSSFFWFPTDGKPLDPRVDRILLEYLPLHFYPFRPKEIERVAAFQNRLLRKFAEARGFSFIDVAGQMPRDPNLFVDPIHATYPGVRLHAWIVAQELATLIAKRLSERRLPRAAAPTAAMHPAFAAADRTITYECRRRSIGASPRPVITGSSTGLRPPP